MKESFWIVLIITLGVICIAFINFFQSYTNTDEQNYELLRETTEAAMYDALDLDAYQLGQVRINREKFVENFVRRFAESVTLGSTYEIDIYDVNETPPKVSLRVRSKINSNKTLSNVEEFNIDNKLDAILENTY